MPSNNAQSDPRSTTNNPEANPEVLATRPHRDQHYSGRVGWLRAAVLGANDGLVSTASLLVGVAAADASRDALVLAGTAGLVAGAMSMAAGEYVSVSSQADTELADIERERLELSTDPAGELAELASSYVARGVSAELALEVAQQLTATDGLAAHVRDELGLVETNKARPTQAAFASALTFTVGAILPLLVVLVASASARIPAIAATTLIGLILLGILGARAGGASSTRAAIRVAFWGSLAMAITAGVGAIFSTVV